MKFFRQLFIFFLASFGFEGHANNCCGNLYVTADYLLWKAHVGKLEYAIDGISFPAFSGDTKELDWKWDSGFKAGVGYVFPDCGWDFYLNYTHYHTKAEGSALPESGNLLYATYSNPFLFDINFASSEFELDYNTLDLEFRNLFYANCCFQFGSIFGCRMACTHDKDEIFYDGFVTDEEIYITERFRGLGPRIGINTAWNFCGGFSLFGEAEYALLWGNHLGTFFSRSNGIVAAYTAQKYSTLRNLVDLNVGLDWTHCFCRSTLVLQLAWEHRIWFDYNQYFRFIDSFSLNYQPNASALSLYGLTLGAKYYF